MRQNLIQVLSEFIEGKVGTEKLHGWVIANIMRAAKEDDPEAREAFRQLDILLFRRLTREASDEEIWLAADTWLRRLRTALIDTGAGVKTGSEALTASRAWADRGTVSTFRHVFSMARH